MKSHWQIYDAITGRLVGRNYYVEESDVALNVNSGEAAIPGADDYNAYYVTSTTVTTISVTSFAIVNEQRVPMAVETLTYSAMVPTARPPNPATFAVTSGNVLRVDSIPPGGIVRVTGDCDPATYVPTSGWWEGDFPSGNYYIEVTRFPYQTFTDARSFG